MKDINILTLIINFLITVITVLLTIYFKERVEGNKTKKSILFGIYMELLELYTMYSMIEYRDRINEEYPESMAKIVHEKSFIIRDKLRSREGIPFQNEILEVLMDNTSFKNMFERTSAIDKLLTKIGKAINPKLSIKIKEIEHKNIRQFAHQTEYKLNAPALMDPLSIRLRNMRVRTALEERCEKESI